MAYFSNGSEGMAYENAYCSRCANYFDRDNSGLDSCPILDAHFEANYEQCGDSELAKTIKRVLSELIPESEKGFPMECSMFRPKQQRDYYRDVLLKDGATFGEWLG